MWVGFIQSVEWREQEDRPPLSKREFSILFFTSLVSLNLSSSTPDGLQTETETLAPISFLLVGIQTRPVGLASLCLQAFWSTLKILVMPVSIMAWANSFIYIYKIMSYILYPKCKINTHTYIHILLVLFLWRKLIQGRVSLVGCHLWSLTGLDMTDVT